jgi:ankyrin repeat protein
MRDNSNIELCRALCQSFAAGPGTPNSTKSLPLHFASKRWKPNKELLKLLIRRNPGAAAVFNEYGFLPLHCACATTDDLEAVQMIYEAYPEAITMKDRQVDTTQTPH